MHPTIPDLIEVVAKGDETAIAPLMAENVRFLPPTYWAVWHGRGAGRGSAGPCWAGVFRVPLSPGDRRGQETGRSNFSARLASLDAVGVDLITLGEDGLIADIRSGDAAA